MPGKVTIPVKQGYIQFYLAKIITLSQLNRRLVDWLYPWSRLPGTRRFAGGHVWFRPDNESQAISDWFCLRPKDRMRFSGLRQDFWMSVSVSCPTINDRISM